MGRIGQPDRSELILQARGLGARFGDGVALDGFDLDLAPGEIVGILGPNGAGKTTALRLLCGGRRADAGTLTLFGAPVRRSVGASLRRSIGVAGDEPIHFDALTGFENALFFAMAAGLSRARAGSAATALIETLGLQAEAHRPVGEYSLGMRRKLLLVETMAHDPALIVLDEPTGGLDAGGRGMLAGELSRRAALGAAVVIATHDFVTAAALCDRVLFLLAGRTVLAGRPAELVARLGGATRYEFAIAASRAPNVAVPGVEIALSTATRLIAHAPNGASPLPALCAAILESGAAIEAAFVRRPDLGDVYLRATGRELAA